MLLFFWYSVFQKTSSPGRDQAVLPTRLAGVRNAGSVQSLLPLARQLPHQVPVNGGREQGEASLQHTGWCFSLANDLQDVWVVLCLPAGEHGEQPLQP